MNVDRTELNNLAGKNAPLEKNLLKQHRAWADVTGVMAWDIALAKLLDAWKIERAEG